MTTILERINKIYTKDYNELNDKLFILCQEWMWIDILTNNRKEYDNGVGLEPKINGYPYYKNCYGKEMITGSYSFYNKDEDGSTWTSYPFNIPIKEFNDTFIELKKRWRNTVNELKSIRYNKEKEKQLEKKIDHRKWLIQQIKMMEHQLEDLNIELDI